jgi:DNA-binding MarR family transcriptional regulator
MSGSLMETGPINGALERLFELAVLLVDGMESGLGQQGMTRARAELIWRLRYQGAMTQRELSDALRCTPRNVTGLVDALESDGLVVREPHPTDRRATLVRLTDAGTQAAAAWTEGYRQLASRLFAEISGADLAHFVTILDHVLVRLQADDAPLLAEADPSP